MSHPLDTEALYHCTCGEWHIKSGPPCDRLHITITGHMYWCQRCDFQFHVPWNSSTKMRDVMSKTFIEEHRTCV